MARRLSRLINAPLKPFGLRLSRVPKLDQKSKPTNDPSGLLRSTVEEFHNCFKHHIASDLPDTDQRFEFMVRLIGTGAAEALYILTYLHRSLHLPGDVCEFGVAQGATSALLANELRITDKRLWLFDSFEGLPQPTDKDVLLNDIFNLGSIDAYAGRMKYSIDEVRGRLAEIDFPLERVMIVPGFIEDTIHNTHLPQQVCFAYIDFDFYEPILIALDFLADHLTPGGAIVVDDYGYFSAGAQAAADEFVQTHTEQFELIKPEVWTRGWVILLKKG